MNDSSQVNRNNAPYGGGIYNEGGGTVTLSATSEVYRNTATVDGGGIFNLGIVNGVTPGNVRGNTPDNVAT